MSAPGQLRDEVFRALDTAIANGYGETLASMNAAAIVSDLLDHDSDICEMARRRAGDDAAELLIPHVEAWRAERGRA